jgi:hypothetical protein
MDRQVRTMTRRTTRICLAALAALLLATSQAAAKGLSVPRDYPTIQQAVDAASPGSTVSVKRGTYTEEVVINKDLRLRGGGVGATVIQAPPTLHPYGVHLPSGRALTAIVRVANGANVRISGLTVRGPIPCGVEVTGIHALQGATLDLTNARVTAIQADPASCPPQDAAGRAVVFGTPAHIDVDGELGTAAFGRVTDVTVDHYQHAGISVAGPDGGELSRVTIANDVIRGGWQIPSFQYGIEITEGVVARVTDNEIEANVCGGPFCGPDPINEAQGDGILVLAAPGGTRIVDNHLTGNDVGVYQVVSPGCCRIIGNALIDNRWFGILIQDGDGGTAGNSIVGGQVGVGVVADAVDTTAVLRGDRIRATTVAPVQEIECCGYSATAIVQPH